MKKPIRYLIGGLVLLFCLIAGNARAQSGYQLITFSVVGEYESQTNNVPTDPTETNLYFHLVAFTSANVVEAIALDMFSYPAWTNWRYAGLIRRVNFATGDERIYLNRGGTNEVDVSSFFSTTYISNFTFGLEAAFPAATNNFTANDPNPLQPLFSGTPTNHFASIGMNFISLTTTNLKMNLLGAGFGGLGTHYGVLHKFSGVEDGVRYSGEVQNSVIQVLGTFCWTVNTNLLHLGASPGTNTFYSGPAHGTITFGVPAFSPKALPAPPSD